MAMRRLHGFTLIELLVVITIIGILAGISLPNYLKAKNKAREVQCRANLHILQTALENYSTDNSGNYPQYLIGGDDSGWTRNAATSGRAADKQPPYDPLLAGGYVSQYPQNPFVSDGISTVVAWSYGDQANAAPGLGDVRFGYKGDTIGNTLDDPRYLWETEGTPSKLQYTFAPTATVGLENTSANETTPFYMMGGVPNPEAPAETLHSGWWPGEFFYRVSGDYVLRDEVNGGQNVKSVWQLPFTARNRYFMGVYGAQETLGKDVIRLVAPGANGANPALIRTNTDGAIDNLFYRNNSYGGFSQVKFSAPEVMGGGDRDTMPYFPPIDPNDATVRIYGAPDGYFDGIIEVVSSEKDSSEGGQR